MDTVHVYRDGAGEFRWKRVAANGEEVADSGEGYTEHETAVGAAEREAGDDAKVVDDTAETPEE